MSHQLRIGNEIYRFAAEPEGEDEEKQFAPEEGGGKKFELAEGQVDILSTMVMLGVAILMKQSGITDKEKAKEFDFNTLLQQLPQIVKTVAMDKNTLKQEMRAILRYGPEDYVKRMVRQLRSS